MSLQLDSTMTDKPQARHRAAYRSQGVTKKARRLAREAVEAEEVCTAPWQAVEAQEAFYFSTNRNRDERNAVAMLKAYYDGIVDSGLIPDDNHQVLSHGQPTFQHDGDNPRVEITITRK
jgi:hypothetical protein